MDKEPKSASSLPGNGIVAIVLLAAGVLFVREMPLETTRLPANEPRLEQHYSKQDVDARLWQDPFGAIAKYRADLRKTGQEKLEREDRLRSTEDLAREVQGFVTSEKRPVQVLAVMLPGGPYAENVESRRRGRYAVLSALNVSRLSPVDTEHLGYFTPPKVERAEIEERPADPIPYEWFQPATDVRARESSKSSLQSRVLVMWLQSEAFFSRPLEQLARLAVPFVNAGANWHVLGPNGSDGLKAMIDEAADPNFKSRPVHESMRFYSLYATVPDEVLLQGRKKDEKDRMDMSKFFLDRGISLVRTIGDDGGLADALIAELKLRGLKPRRVAKEREDGGASGYQEACDINRDTHRDTNKEDAPSRIALVAEWDTLYGRSLMREFRAKPDERGFCVERFNYVRGLDGQLPASSGGGDGDGGARKPDQPEKDLSRRKDGTFIELAEGQNQFDYLRRLAVQMRTKDALVRSKSADGQGFRAIGVLGNDVHDKLLVLQALRPEFPDVIFFTTDLDARLMHPREQTWTRNLIVASNFGLRLTDGLQGGAPPFRDSYQVSAFLSTRLAMDDARRKAQADGTSEGKGPLPQDKILSWFAAPRIFEIGRTGAFDFKGAWPAMMDGGDCRGTQWSGCDDIHPAGSRPYPSPGKPMMFLVFFFLLLVLWIPPLAVSPGMQARIADALASRDKRQLRAPSWVILGLVLLGVQILLPLWLASNWDSFAAWLTEEGKPLVAIEGISIWPTEGIRIVTLLLCFYLLLRGWVMLDANLEQIARNFDAGIVRQEMTAMQDAADLLQRLWRNFAQIFSMRFIPPLHWRTGDVEGMTADAVDFWGRHIVQNRLWARLVRTATCVAIAWVFSLLLMHAIGESRFVPQRGDISRQVHDWLRLPALLMMYFLVFFVVDATVLCVRFVRGLLRLRQPQGHAANWPGTTLKRFETDMGMPRAYLQNWIDLQFIARRTHAVTRLIYYPFIVMSLWLLSRSAVFDNWTMSVSTLLPAVVGAVIALACAIALRRAAEDSRDRALERIRNEILCAKADPPMNQPSPAPTVDQLEMLEKRIEELHQGAFAPFWQQPLLKALLLPFATLGGTTVLDYMALANL